MKTLSIYHKLIVYFLLVSLLPLGVIGVLFYVEINSVVRGHAVRLLNAVAVESADKIARAIEQSRVEVGAWAELPSIRRALDGDTSAAITALNRLVTAYGKYDLVVIVDAGHQIVAGNEVGPARHRLRTAEVFGSYLGDGPWFSPKADGDIYVSGFQRSSLIERLFGDKRPDVIVSAPIIGRGRRVVGYLIAYLDWTYLQDILDVARALFAEDMDANLFMLEMGANRFIAHRNIDLYGESYSVRVDLEKIVESNPAGTLNVDWPESKTLGYSQVRGADPAKRMPWLVIAEAPDEVIYREIALWRTMFLTLIGVAAVAVVVLVSFISRRFSEPLLQLVRGAQAIAAGDMRVEMPVESVDEIGILANTFNQMSDSLRERDEALRLTNQQLQEANRLKSEFLANVSHELRTPMNSIIGFTTLVLQRAGEALPEQQRANLGKVRRNALHLLKLLNSILDLSKIEAGSSDLVIEEFSLAGLVEGCTHTIAPLLEGRDIQLSTQIPDGELLMVTDRQKIQQVLINLLGNAAKFTERGYIRAGFALVGDPGVSVGPDDKGPWVRLWIEDSGIGIREDDLPHIFTEFRQVDGSPSRRYQGTGLGLSISKKLAKILGGDILVKSEPGFGSTFSVVIPQRHAAAQPLVRDETDHVMPETRPAIDRNAPDDEAPKP